MSYTPPSYNAVNFALESGYTAPAYNAVNFALGDVIAGESIAFSLYPVTASIAATFVAAPDIIATIPAVTASLAASVGRNGVISASLPVVTGSLAASQSALSTINTTLPAVTASLGATNTHLPRHGDIGATLPAVTASFHGIFHPKADITATVPAVTASLGASNTHLPINADIDITLPAVTGTINSFIHGSISASTPKVRANVTTTIPRVVSGWSRYFSLNKAHVSGGFHETFLVPLTGNVEPILSTISFRAGKHYAEVLINYSTGVTNSNMYLGVGRRDCPLVLSQFPGYSNKSWGMYASGLKYHDNVYTAGGPNFASPTAPVVFQIALDSTNGRVWFGANGVWWGTGNPSTDTDPTFTDTDLVDELVHIMVASASAGNRTLTIRELAAQFTYSVPTGFTAWGQDSPATWDTERRIAMKVGISGGATRYNLPVAVHLDNDCGGVSHYDGRTMIRDLDLLLRRFTVLDADGIQCPVIVTNVKAFVDPVQYSIPARSDTYTNATQRDTYVADTVWPAYEPVNYQVNWYSTAGTTGSVKVNIDLGTARVLNRLSIVNFTNLSSTGMRQVSFYGTNSDTAFANTTYSNLDDLTLLADITVERNNLGAYDNWVTYDFAANPTPFRYYVFRLHNNYGDTSNIGYAKIRFFDAPVDELDFITVLPEVSGASEEPFDICWDTAKYESDTDTSIDYTYPIPDNIETNIVYPPGLNPTASIQADLPSVYGTILTGFDSASVIIGRLQKVRAVASARSGNVLKATMTHVTATGISATNVLFYEEVKAEVVASVRPVIVSMGTGQRIHGECAPVMAEMRASRSNRAALSGSLNAISVDMITGASMSAEAPQVTAMIVAANGHSCSISAELPEVHGSVTGSHVEIRHGDIEAILAPIIAGMNATSSKPNDIHATLPMVVLSAQASSRHRATIAGILPKATVKMTASPGSMARINTHLPWIDAVIKARAETNTRLLRHTRGETR